LGAASSAPTPPILGEATSDSVLEMPVAEDEAAGLAWWVVPGRPPKLLVDVVEISVERLLAGSAQTTVAIAAPRAMQAGTGGPAAPAMPATGARGLVFLQRVPEDEPYARHLPRGAYRIPPEEPGLLAFEEQDFDARGRAVTRDRTPDIEMLAEAVEWYAEVRQAVDRTGALAEAIGSSNERIARAALRELAQEASDQARATLREASASASGEMGVRVAVAMWLAGDEAAAKELAGSLAKSARWLSSCGLSRSVGRDGSAVLYGPDPAAARSD
jgi:hypothetical protein